MNKIRNGIICLYRLFPIRLPKIVNGPISESNCVAQFDFLITRYSPCLHKFL